MMKWAFAAFALGLALPAGAMDRNAPEAREALEIYRTLIGFHTAAGHGQVPAMAKYLAGKFREAGFANGDISVLPKGETAALTVRYRGDGSSGKAPILLLAHMDVVEALRQDWKRDPFTLTEEDGYFFGRGTDDNKLGVLQLSVAFLQLKRADFVPTRDLVLAFSGDEETGMLTTRALAADESLAGAEFALNSDAGGGVLDEQGKPRSYAMQVAEKTYASFELTVRNPGGHSSRPRRDNAIYELAEALGRLRGHRFPVRHNEVTREYFRVTGAATGGGLGKAMRAFAADPEDAAAQDALAADPAYVGTTRTTCIPTMLEAGHAENALPQSATATVNCRIFPGTRVADVQAELARVVDNEAVTFKLLGDPVESAFSMPRDDVTAAVAKAVHARYPDLPIVPEMSSGGTDGMHFRAAGVPTYGVGGLFMKDSDVFAHGLNERVPVDGFYASLDHWPTLLKALAGR